jgi:hypothetical protein
VALPLFDDQVPIHSLGNQRFKFGALFRVCAGAADYDVDDFRGDRHIGSRWKREEGRGKQKKTYMSPGAGPSVVYECY